MKKIIKDKIKDIIVFVIGVWMWKDYQQFLAYDSLYGQGGEIQRQELKNMENFFKYEPVSKPK